jgi:hypothetical protein
VLSRTKGKVTHPGLLGKEDGAEVWGKESFQGLLFITAVQVDPTRVSAGALEVRSDFLFGSREL